MTYAFSQGSYLIAWGPLLFGGFQLVRGLLRYLTVPSGARKAGQLGLLGGVIAVGILSAGFVGVSEGIGAQEAAQNAKASLQTSIQSRVDAEGQLQKVWEAEGKPKNSSIEWAASVVAQGTATLAEPRCGSQGDWLAAFVR